MALVPQVVDAVKVPVIAAGGIADARGIVAAFALGAAAVQIGTAYLFCPEAKISARHREALKTPRTMTQFSRTCSLVGPPVGSSTASSVRLARCRTLHRNFHLRREQWLPCEPKQRQQDRETSRPCRSGQAAVLSREVPAGDLTRQLGAEALAHLSRIASASSSRSV